MVNVVLDSDLLSAFLKIEALHRVREYFRADTLLVPTAVFREVALTTLLPQLTGTEWLEVREVRKGTLDTAATSASPGFGELGAGEREAIALAYELEGAVLTNDRKALSHASDLELRAVNVPAFLLMYRALGGQAVAEVRKLVEALEEKDHYGFPEQIRRRLLSEP